MIASTGLLDPGAFENVRFTAPTPGTTSSYVLSPDTNSPCLGNLKLDSHGPSFSSWSEKPIFSRNRLPPSPPLPCLLGRLLAQVH